VLKGVNLEGHLPVDCIEKDIDFLAAL